MSNDFPNLTRLWRTTRWLLINGAFAYVAWLAVHGHKYATNFVPFFAWLNAIVGFLSACVVVSAVNGNKALEDNLVKIDKAKRLGRPVPKWLPGTYDFALICLFGWHGWYLTAIAMLFSYLNEANLWGAIEKRQAPTVSPS